MLQSKHQDEQILVDLDENRDPPPLTLLNICQEMLERMAHIIEGGTRSEGVNVSQLQLWLKPYG